MIFSKIHWLKKRWTLIFLIVFLTIPIILPLFRKGFFSTQDYIYVARIYQMDKSLKDGQFPVRWVSDFRYGEPLYNFYAPLSYYAGSLIHTFGFGFLSTTKILFGLGFILSGITMYYLGKALFGRAGGLLSAVLYIYAPYHSVDVYVRGALAESWSLIFFPLIFLSSYKLIQKPSTRNLIFLSLSLASLFFTHNIMTVLFLPFFAGWLVFCFLLFRNFKSLKYVIPSLLLGFGLSATFLLPAFFEKDFVQSKYLLNGYFDFRGHFVAIPQFFSTFWGYGASLWGSKDDMSFQVGLAHWVVLTLSLILAIVFRKDKKMFYLDLFLIFEFLFSLFMQHNRSAPIWEKFSILAYTQFPWRFLGISIFLSSLFGGSLIYFLKDKYKFILPILIPIIISVYVGYFHPSEYYYDSIDDHYISSQTLSKDDRLPKDYLPAWVKEIKEDKLLNPHAKNGKVEVLNFEKRSNSSKFNVKVLEDSQIEIPITYFPGWEVKANGKKILLDEPSNLGLILFKLPKGEYKVNAYFANTPIRQASNLISFLSGATLLGTFLRRSKYETNK